MTHRTQRLPRIVLLAGIALIPVVALASTPNVTVFTVADDGDGPLEVKIIVRATNADANTLFCKLSTWGDDGPYEDHSFFTLDPPYDEVVFTQVYESGAVDYHPTVRCQDEGVSTDSSPVTVRNAPTNGEPYVTVTGPTSPRDAALPMAFNLETFDPDGDTLLCRVDYGEFGDDPEEIVIGPPYTARTLQHTYERPSVNGGGYNTQVFCSDSMGGTAFGSVNSDVFMSPGNSNPTFDLVRNFSFNGNAPRDVTFTLRAINDSGSDTLDCYFDAKDGFGRQPFTVFPPYSNVSLSAHYTEAFELLIPIVACSDGRGGYLSDTALLGVHEPTGNSHPTITLASSVTSGVSPLAVDLTVHAEDKDGDTLSCVLDYGIGQTSEEFEARFPYSDLTFQHVFEETNSYQVSVECKERKGGTSREALWVVADTYEAPSNYDPITRFTASPDSGTATLGVSFFVSGMDPDGDDVTCDLDFGDGLSPRTVVLEAPSYTQEWATHTFFTASTTPYSVLLTCTDANGGLSTRTMEIQVDRAENNAEPVIQQFVANTTSGDAPLSVGFSLTANDSDTGVVSCTLDYGDGNSSNWRMSVPLSVTPNHTYAAGNYQANLYCCDDITFGGQCGPNNIGVAMASLPIDAGAVNRAPTVSMHASATEGIAPLNVTFNVTGFDPDGNDLTCWLDTATATPQSVLVISAPYAPTPIRQTFSDPGQYTARATCDDGNGGLASTRVVSISVLPPGNSENSRRDSRRTGSDSAGSGEVSQRK